MPSDADHPRKDPTPEDIQKMLEEARTKAVPPHILKGFKDDVMRRIESESVRRPKSGRWFGTDFKLPRVGMSVGFGALACLLVASLAVFTMEKPDAINQQASGESAGSSFQIASLPAVSPLPAAPPAGVAFDKTRTTASPVSSMSLETSGAAVAGAEAVSAAAKPAPAKRAKLTVEEELRLIEEFDDRKFFIRQDITEADLASV